MSFSQLPLQRSIEEAKNELLALGYHFKQRTPRSRALFGVLGLVAMMCWLTLFMLGCWIKTGPERADLASHGFQIGPALHVLLFWTPTNVCFLGLLAAFIAGCLSYNCDPRAIQANLMRALVHNDLPVVDRLQRQLEYLYEQPWVSMKRSFAVYLLVITSSYLLDVSPFAEPPSPAEGQLKYVHMAGITSALSFVMGNDPTRFQGLIERVGGWSSSARFDPPQQGRGVVQGRKVAAPPAQDQALEDEGPSAMARTAGGSAANP